MTNKAVIYVTASLLGISSIPTVADILLQSQANKIVISPELRKSLEVIMPDAGATPRKSQLNVVAQEVKEKYKVSLQDIKHIDYAELQRVELTAFVDHVWELYDLYFPAPEISSISERPLFINRQPPVSPWPRLTDTTPPATPFPLVTPRLLSSVSPTPTPTPKPEPVLTPPPSHTSYANERKQFYLAFLNAFLEFAANAAAAGVIGNLVYDVLKRELLELRDSAIGKTRDCYDKVTKDFVSLAERLRQAQRQNETLYIREMAKYTGEDIVKARAWAKAFGWTHTSSCYWHAPKASSS